MLDHYFKVSEVAELLNKSEETIKRWIRSGHFPNAIKESDKKGWRIPERDFSTYHTTKKVKLSQEITTSKAPSLKSHQDDRELVILAFEAVTMTSPTEEIIGLLSYIGIKRTLEILLVMQQSPSKVKNPIGFIKRAISKGWSPSTLPIKKERNVARNKKTDSNQIFEPTVPFYNWLEE